MNESTLSIALALRDHQCRAELRSIVKNMDGVCPATESDAADILIFEVENSREKEFLEMSRALMDQVRGEIFLVCANPAPKFLISAMRAGVQEVLPLPLGRKELGQAIARYRERAITQTNPSTAPGKGRIIGVVGARPGVGATTLAVNLACHLQSQGPTALMDMAVPLGEALLFLDIEYTYTWGDVAQNLSRLDSSYLEGVMPRHSSGLSFLASPGTNLPPDANKAMRPIMDELRRGFKHTIIDTDNLLSPCGLKELDRADEVVAVINLTLPCLAHALRLNDTLRSLESSGTRVRVAVSRYLKGSDILPAEAEEILGRKVDWLIPEDGPAALAAVNQGHSLAESAPKSAATKAIKTIAESLAETAGRSAGKGLGSLFRRRSAPVPSFARAEVI